MKGNTKFKSHMRMPSDSQVFTATKGVPFKRCPSCGNGIISSAKWCPECARLRELGMRDSVRQFNPKQDTQPVQSYSSNNTSRYSDRIPTGKIPPTRERY
jgi:hypothetical protein